MENLLKHIFWVYVAAVLPHVAASPFGSGHCCCWASLHMQFPITCEHLSGSMRFIALQLQYWVTHSQQQQRRQLRQQKQKQGV